MLDVLWMILMMPEMPDPKPGAPLGLKGPLESSRAAKARRERTRPARRKAPASARMGARRSVPQM